jgi:type II secretory pathway pseudopilin PulG
MIELNLSRKRKIGLLQKNVVIRNYPNSGITLVEVLIASLFSVFVIAGGAFGLTAMMQRNAIIEARSQRRMDLDRAINYIADEIKSTNDVQAVALDSTFPGDGTGVLLLSIPGSGTNPQRRVYFIRPSTDTWFGPNTINRYEGTITNPVTGIPLNADRVLVDGITTPNSTELMRIQRLCTNTTGAVFRGTGGFYACINAATDTVDLYLYGRLEDIAGSLKDPTLENLAVTTRVFARGTTTPP